MHLIILKKTSDGKMQLQDKHQDSAASEINRCSCFIIHKAPHLPLGRLACSLWQLLVMLPAGSVL